MSKTKHIIIYSLLILALATVIVGGVWSYSVISGQEFAIVGYEEVYKQNWGNICCVQEFDYDIIVGPFGLDERDFLDCNDYTNECKIIIKSTETSGFFGTSSSGSYQICPSGYENRESDECTAKIDYLVRPGDSKEITIPVGKAIFIPIRFFTFGEDTTTIAKKVKSFYLKGMENGKVYRQESCILSSELKGKVAMAGLNELSKTGPNQCQNYMLDFVKVATRTYEYRGEEVICQARQLYNIDEILFKDGRTNKIQADFITPVDCCPAEANCNPETFKFDVFVRDCSITSECSNGGNPIAVSATSYVRYNCDLLGRCIRTDPITTECTTNLECIRKHGAGYICDLNINNWGNCKKSTTPNFCGDGKCDELDGENENTCPDDCGVIAPLPFSWLPIIILIIGIFAFIIIIIIGQKLGSLPKKGGK